MLTENLDLLMHLENQVKRLAEVAGVSKCNLVSGDKITEA
jgi:hypothetical protein